MTDWLGRLYIVLKSTTRVTGGIPLLELGYKYNYRKVLGFIATEGSRSTKPGDSYLSCFLEMYPNVSIRPVVLPQFLGRYFNDFNAIDNKNRMQNYDLALEKYWVAHSGYFRLETTLALGFENDLS